MNFNDLIIDGGETFRDIIISGFAVEKSLEVEFNFIHKRCEGNFPFRPLSRMQKSS